MKTEMLSASESSQNGRKRKTTATSSFGVSNREGHDSSGFYSRFELPVLSEDETVNRPETIDCIICGDARKMNALPDNSIGLVVTSPPYFAGKAYEMIYNEEIRNEAICNEMIHNGETGAEKDGSKPPASYQEYLKMLQEVFTECYRVLEPGGRIAVNVANLGRKPYRSLSSDVIRILQDEIGFLLRGEIIWQKAAGASGNCAWGSFAKATNPVLRDVSERIIVACKGRFDRAISVKKRKKLGLPYESTIGKEDFMNWTLDLWSVPPESARRTGHPAPFPVEIPRRLIELYTYRGDTVLDPFMGSGTTAIAAIKTGRHYIGYELEPEYCRLAEKRISMEQG
jgi:site-specific DNA-methyltransferase (adenine-specific)